MLCGLKVKSSIHNFDSQQIEYIFIHVDQTKKPLFKERLLKLLGKGVYSTRFQY